MSNFTTFQHLGRAKTAAAVANGENMELEDSTGKYSKYRYDERNAISRVLLHQRPLSAHGSSPMVSISNSTILQHLNRARIVAVMEKGEHEELEVFDRLHGTHCPNRSPARSRVLRQQWLSQLMRTYLRYQ